MKRFLLLLAAASSFAASSAYSAEHAAAPAKAKADPAKGQAIATAVCGGCHGVDGNSAIAANPKLAGQHADYLLKQMKNFKGANGATPERVNPVMNGMIAAYDENQMRDLSAWFSSQPLKPEVAKNRETIEFGQRIYRAGDESKGLPACAGCHGPTGAGIPAQYPRLGGQFADYTESQLKSFRAGAQVTTAADGARANDPNKMMRMVAIKMTDSEIKAVADYIAGLR